MSKPPKIDRKSLKQPDEFQSKGRKSVEWMSRNRPILLAIVVSVLGLGLLNFAYNWYGDGQVQNAWVAIYERPISDLNLSVRARKCMIRLGISSISELVRRRADDLLECKNKCAHRGQGGLKCTAGDQK